MTEGRPPAGWYDDGRGVVRWFDGVAWTDDVQPAEPPLPFPDGSADLSPAPADDPLWLDPARDSANQADPSTDPAPAGHRAVAGASTAPLVRRPWFLAAVVVVLLLAAGAFVLSRDPQDAAAPPATPTNSVSPSPSVPATTSAPATTPATAPGSGGLVDGDWSVVSYRFQDNGIGDFGGTARIKYTGTETAGGAGNFTFTVFKGGKQVATLVGSVLDARPGQTKATDLISTDRYRPGPYSAVEFRKDL